MTEDNLMAVLTQDGVNAEFAKLDSLAESLKAKTGTFAQRKREAGTVALGATFTFGKDDSVPESLGNLAAILHELHDPKSKGVRLEALATQLQGVNEWAAHVHGEATAQVLKGTGGGEDELATLRTAFDDQRKRCEALMAVAEVIPGMDVLVAGKSIPQLRTPRASGGGGSATKRFGTFYRITPDGQKRYQPDSQDKLSSVAWAFGALMLGKPGEGDRNDGKGVATPDLETHLRTITDSPLGKPWEYAVTTDAGTITFGFEVKGQEATKADEEE
jgi:hypothetical protein